jgi:hypothetical protein
LLSRDSLLGKSKPYGVLKKTFCHSEVSMKKFMAVVVALMFVSTMMFSSLAFAGARDKGKAPMSDKAKDGAQVSEDAKAKDKGKSKEAKMRHKDKKEKKSKKEKKHKKSKGDH